MPFLLTAEIDSARSDHGEKRRKHVGVSYVSSSKYAWNKARKDRKGRAVSSNSPTAKLQPPHKVLDSGNVPLDQVNLSPLPQIWESFNLSLILCLTLEMRSQKTGKWMNSQQALNFQSSWYSISDAWFDRWMLFCYRNQHVWQWWAMSQESS